MGAISRCAVMDSVQMVIQIIAIAAVAGLIVLTIVKHVKMETV